MEKVNGSSAHFNGRVQGDDRGTILKYANFRRIS